ncbi:MAG: hypothetical protein HeimC3_48460 [Candidatus Heimdallarchaeota archaeon LC_3]|nr:MAG: hypothetical protein HeimC3_48460 [Candidatus Heimdallarchaeota archaeon LC_3]
MVVIESSTIIGSFLAKQAYERFIKERNFNKKREIVETEFSNDVIKQLV